MKYIKLFEEFKINEMDNQNFPFINVDTDFIDILKKMDDEGVDTTTAKKTIEKIVTRIQAMTYVKHKADSANPAEVKKVIVKLLTTFDNMLNKDGSISDDTYKNILLKEFGEKLVSLVKKQLDYIQKNKMTENVNQTEISSFKIENYFADTLYDLELIGFNYKVAQTELQSIIDNMKQTTTTSNNLVSIVDSTVLDFENLLDQATYPRSGMVRSIKTESDLNNKKVEILNNFKKLIKPYVSYSIRFFNNK